MSGGAGDDTFIGGSNNESLSGGAGSDLFIAGSGNETIDGGSGQNALTYAGTSIADATITTNNKGVTTISIAGGSTDKVEDVQTVIFSDQVIHLP